MRVEVEKIRVLGERHAPHRGIALADLLETASLENAEKDAARARELAPDDARVLLTTADLAARRGRADDARAALRQGLKARPDDMDLRLALATLELQTGRPKEAEW